MTGPGVDLALEQVVAALQQLDPDGNRCAQALRRTYDQLYDGIHTRRYRWDQLYKTEKTHFGTLIEINLQREFAFADGDDLDYKIAGHEVDAKYSDSGVWMLPPEAIGKLCLVITASDERSEFSIGVVRASREHLNPGQNRDGKRTLSASGRAAIHWLHRRSPMPENLLLHLPQETIDLIWAKGPRGAPMVVEAFRLVPNRRMGRAVVETLARQLDPTKRVRGNGGARTRLRSEGLIILSGDYVWQREIASDLGLEPIGDGDFISAYVREADPVSAGPKAQIGTSWWQLATRETAAEWGPELLPPGGSSSYSDRLQRFRKRI